MNSVQKSLKIVLGILYCSIGLILSVFIFAGLRSFSLKSLTLSQEELKKARRIIQDYPTQHKKLKCKSGYTVSFVVKSHKKSPKGTLLFLHGFPNFWFIWRDYLNHYYDQGYDVLAVNTRGNGDSSKPNTYRDYCYQSMTDLIKKYKLKSLYCRVCHI